MPHTGNETDQARPWNLQVELLQKAAKRQSTPSLGSKSKPSSNVAVFQEVRSLQGPDQQF